MDASRTIHASAHRAPGNDFCTQVGAFHFQQLVQAALQLACGRINRRTVTTSRGRVEEYFCMECRAAAAVDKDILHAEWCKADRIFQLTDAMELTEMRERRGPGVGGYTPIRGVSAGAALAGKGVRDERA